MSHLTKVFIVVAWSLALLPGVSSGQMQGSAAADSLDLGLAEVEAWASRLSPRALALGHRLDSLEASRREDLTWSNPAIAYDHEESDSAREWQFTLHKRFTRPFARGVSRLAWDDRIEAEELKNTHELGLLAADLKAGYVRLRLMDDQSDRLRDLADLVDLAAETARLRRAEGELSGLEEQLIRLAAASLQAGELRIRSEQRRLRADWQVDMGIPPATTVRLTTPVDFRAVDPGSIAALQAAGETSAGNLSALAMASALDRQAEAVRPGLIPGFDLYGGYKSFAGDGSGIVAGLALDLPLFDRGTGAADRLQAERRLVDSDRQAGLARRRAETGALAASVMEAQPLLDEFREAVVGVSLTGALLLSYREGAITLDELLGAIQIESSALSDYFEGLADYYRDIFRLEALTGAEIVHFAP